MSLLQSRLSLAKMLVITTAFALYWAIYRPQAYIDLYQILVHL